MQLCPTHFQELALLGPPCSEVVSTVHSSQGPGGAGDAGQTGSVRAYTDTSSSLVVAAAVDGGFITPSFVAVRHLRSLGTVAWGLACDQRQKSSSFYWVLDWL